MPSKEDPRRAVASAEANAEPESVPAKRRPPARGRVATWTNLKSTGARLNRATDWRLTKAAERTGQGVQDIWEAAINAYCDRLGIPQKMPDDASTKLPSPERYQERGGLKLVVVRLTHNTRARLAEACIRQYLGGGEGIVEALNEHFDEVGIPQPPKDILGDDQPSM
ncbi:hypothetical protein [Nonomuraea endophytica]|uniref:hypothetical protein n=1 Tax=Nonomuraea endophytica TaxID=714136 RepID=UPI0037C977AF